jgi:hypothetical protein
VAWWHVIFVGLGKHRGLGRIELPIGTREAGGHEGVEEEATWRKRRGPQQKREQKDMLDNQHIGV